MDDERRQRRCGRGVAVGVAKQTNVDFRSSNFCGRIFGALIFALFDFLHFRFLVFRRFHTVEFANL